ncbi:hypothetical protein SAMN05421640_3343 [Ekhidna lutea]|uniref:Uncharacterized protein n=1 Tax=Ekhidna lutea TaxID=447679 RepID=A0A239LN37_EKHLU|nr:hypothetical protein [Ekhidna lutea]SNT31004.1 hypothetical protein SAMN05421640_3343 [Ekhidna lutea]
MKKIIFIGLTILLAGCENKDINEGEEFRPRAVNDSFDDTHFTKITVDGVEYLMTERDNNNPHEGFGFMAFRANKLMEKQDTIISYLKAMQFFQNKVYARMYGISADSGQAEFEDKLQEFFLLETKELEELEREDLSNTKPE